MNTSDFNELATLYNEYMGEISEKNDFVVLSHHIIDELARISYNLVEDHKDVVLNNLKPRVQNKNQF